MRENLFRGLDKLYNKAAGYKYNVWRFGSLIEYDNGQVAIVASADRYGGGVFTNEVIPETVAQYTGIDDKNGTKIFVGDILLEKDAGVWEKFTKEDGSEWSKFAGKREDKKYVVFFDDKTAQFTTEGCWLWALGKLVEVIGNIHDNPELMEVGE